MNIQSIILLIIVLGAFAIVGYRYFLRQKKSHNCGGCSCGCDNCDACQ